MTDDTPLPPAPVLVDVEYDSGNIVVTGTSTDSGTVTVYDGDTPVVSTTTVIDDSPDAPAPYVFRAVFAHPTLTPGEHQISACVTTGPDNLTSQWATPRSVTVP